MNDLVKKLPSRRFYKTEISIYGSKYISYTLYLVTPETFGRVSWIKSTESFISDKKNMVISINNQWIIFFE